MKNVLLKLNDNNDSVEKLQELLEIPADGIFGPITELAVKEFQKEHGLVVDGIVGNKTWDALLATTDLSETYSYETEDIDIKNHFLSAGEYLKGPTKKRWLFLHHTAGWNNPYKTVNNWNNDTRGKVATEFCLGGQKITDNDSEYDGVIVKCIPDGGYGWHLGIGNNAVHRESVGIECNNFGQLTKGGYNKIVNGKKGYHKSKNNDSMLPKQI